MENSNMSTIQGIKSCHIIKRANFDGYGFNLHSEKVKPGQYIGKVDENSPAELAGLKEGDRIIEVNGEAIGNATHKQVVQRIKTLSNEVRLLLVSEKDDAQSGVMDKPTATNGNNDFVDNDNQIHGTKLEIPGASANISSISMVTTKRASVNSSSSSAASSPSGLDEMDNNNSHNINNNSNDKEPILYESAPSPPSASTEQIRTATTGVHGIPVPPPVVPPSSPSPLLFDSSDTTNVNDTNHSSPSPSPTKNYNIDSGGLNTPNKAGSLHLPTTAAEMRAKLLSKKKRDPKSESVDLKKKFEIIQKL